MSLTPRPSATALGAEVGAGFRAGASKEIPTSLRLVLFALVWSAYWSRSVRVRATFGSGALDRGYIVT